VKKDKNPVVQVFLVWDP